MPTTDNEDIICKYLTIWDAERKKSYDESVIFACVESVERTIIFLFFFFTFVFRLPPSDFPVLFPEFCFLFYVSYDWFLSTIFFLLISAVLK